MGDACPWCKGRGTTWGCRRCGLRVPVTTVGLALVSDSGMEAELYAWLDRAERLARRVAAGPLRDCAITTWRVPAPLTGPDRLTRAA